MSTSDEEGLSTSDWLRYGFLVLLASLLWLVVFGSREGGVASLLAVYLLAAAGTLLWVRFRKERT